LPQDLPRAVPGRAADPQARGLPGPVIRPPPHCLAMPPPSTFDRWIWLEACELLAKAERLQREFFRLAPDEGIAATTVDARAVPPILGPRRFEAELAMRTGVPGVATGLACTCRPPLRDEKRKEKAMRKEDAEGGTLPDLCCPTTRRRRAEPGDGNSGSAS
jgi:hypothetical protein